MDLAPATPALEDDAELLRRSADGQEEAFRRLVRRHHPRLRRLARRLCAQEQDAEDLLQETFLRALRAAGRFQPRAAVDAWLRSILRNAFLDLERRRRRRPESSWEEHHDATLPATGPGPDRRWEQQRLRARLDAALQRLAPEERLAFVLSAVEGLSYREIAGICGCAEGTVASRKHAAVTRLRGWLKEDRP